MRTFVDERGEILFNIDKPPFDIKQCFTSKNKKYTLRGLHCSPYPKYITVNSGKIFDVVVKPDGTYDAYILDAHSTLLIEKNCAHGYFCFEESEVVYFLGGTFDPALEKSYHWNDPTLHIEWPMEVAHAVISKKDSSNPLFKPIESVILGSNGYMGTHLLKYIPNSIGIQTRLEDTATLRKQLQFIKPKYVISSAGITGKPTVDWCETHKEETFFTNVTCQLQLIQLCKNLNIHLTVIGSGAVFDGNKLFTERDEPNFEGTFYSRARVILERAIQETYINDVLYLRVIYPISGDGDPRCFLEKLKTRTGNIHDTRVSVTIIPSLFPKLYSVIQQAPMGILNFVNDDTISLSEMLNIFNIKHTVSMQKSNRGKCCLDCSKLKNYIHVDKTNDLKKIIESNNNG